MCTKPCKNKKPPPGRGSLKNRKRSILKWQANHPPTNTKRVHILEHCKLLQQALKNQFHIEIGPDLNVGPALK